jgi:hypothetical protein
LVDGFGENLLPGARLAGDEHGNPALRGTQRDFVGTFHFRIEQHRRPLARWRNGERSSVARSRRGPERLNHDQRRAGAYEIARFEQAPLAVAQTRLGFVAPRGRFDRVFGIDAKKQRAVGAAQVLDLDALPDVDQQVVARDRLIIDADVVVRPAPQAENAVRRQRMSRARLTDVDERFERAFVRRWAGSIGVARVVHASALSLTERCISAC